MAYTMVTVLVTYTVHTAQEKANLRKNECVYERKQVCVLKCQLTIVKSRWRVRECSLFHFFNFSIRFFQKKKKKWREKKRLEERKWNQYTDNFSEGLVVKETEKWGIGRKSESCGQVFIF